MAFPLSQHCHRRLLDRGMVPGYLQGPLPMEAVLDQPVLVLNRLWQAVNIIGARRAFALLAREHAQVVHQTEDNFRTFSLMDWVDFSTYNPPVDALETVHTVNRATGSHA